MLDFARRPPVFSAKRVGFGALVSIGAHVALIGSVVAVGAMRSEHREEGVEVAFVDRPAAPQPAPVPAEPPAVPEPAVGDPAPPRPGSPVAIAPGAGESASSDPSTETSEEDPYAVPPGSGSTENASGPFVVDPPSPGPIGSAGSGGEKVIVVAPKAKGPIPFSSGMTEPKLLSGRPPVYTRQALEAKIEGTMIVQCVITTAGSVKNCRVLQTVPFMEEAVLTALATRKYTPVTKNGVALDVAYVFRVHLTLK